MYIEAEQIHQPIDFYFRHSCISTAMEAASTGKGQ
jgi:hypothetical protein